MSLTLSEYVLAALLHAKFEVDPRRNVVSRDTVEIDEKVDTKLLTDGRTRQSLLFPQNYGYHGFFTVPLNKPTFQI